MSSATSRASTAAWASDAPGRTGSALGPYPCWACRSSSATSSVYGHGGTSAAQGMRSAVGRPPKLTLQQRGKGADSHAGELNGASLRLQCQLLAAVVAAPH